MSPPAPLGPRRVVLTVLATGLALLGACGQDEALGRRHGGDSVGRTAERLVAGAEYYVGNPDGGPSMAPKQLALTFDDGPGARTSELSTYLKSQNIRAVFFVNGACIQTTALPNDSCGTPTANAAAILAQLTADGHLVGNHTTTHRDITTIPTNQRVQELTETDGPVQNLAKTPWNRSLFRAPFGSWNSDVYGTLSGTSLKHYVGPIYWDVGGGPTDQSAAATMAADWECWQLGYTTKQCADRYLNEINRVGRGIILMHDPYGSAQGSTVDMVKYLVPILKNAGYTFIRADDAPRIAPDFPSCPGTGCVTCSGANGTQCTTCEAGRYVSGGACLTCSTCGPGTYLAAACAPTANTVCNACDPSCVTCSGAGAAACTSCAPGAYLAGGACKACSMCPSGTYLAAECTPATNTVCIACDPSCARCSGPGAAECTSCAADQYLSGGTCNACRSCGPGTYVSSACTATANTICSACDPSCSTCSGPGPASCGVCPAGYFLTGSGACQACTVCAPGAQAAACTSNADSVCTASGDSGSPDTPGSSGAPSDPPDDDAGRSTPNARVDTSGCYASGTGGPPPASSVLGLAVLAFLRRRRRGCARC